MSSPVRRGPTRDTLLVAPRGTPVSFRISRSSVLLTVLAGVAAVAVATASLVLGVYPISVSDAVTIVGGGAPSSSARSCWATACPGH